jgi:hypothetical protein
MKTPSYRQVLRIVGLLFVTSALWAQPTPPRLRVRNDGHALVQEMGTPFFWLGDTASNYFARLN